MKSLSLDLSGLKLLFHCSSGELLAFAGSIAVHSYRTANFSSVLDPFFPVFIGPPFSCHSGPPSDH